MANKKMVLTRRDFVRGTVSTTLGATVLSTVQIPLTHAAEENATSKVLVVRDEKVQGEDNQINTEVLKTMITQVVTGITGKKDAKDAWLSLVKPTDKIGLVNTPHLNKTHSELIDAVTAALIDAGVPKDNILMAQGGLDKVSACTALIALPALKAHWLTGIGTVLKNYITYSGKPKDYHGENNAKLGEIWNLPEVKGKTKLILVDALRPLCDKGPQPDPKYFWNYNGLISGLDPVAVETICLKVIMEKRSAIRSDSEPLSPPPLCIEAADKTYKLGTSNIAQIQIEKIGWADGVLL